MGFFNTNFLDIVKGQYADFDGRARRKEYWMFILCMYITLLALILVVMILGMISSVLSIIFLIITGLVYLALIVPSLAITVRRLHDTNKSGWFILLRFIPLGELYLLYLMVTDGDWGDNQYGPDPKAEERV